MSIDQVIESIDEQIGRLQQAKAFLELCQEKAVRCKGEPDAARDIREIREERAEQI